jgi:hypothetical protein
MFFLMTSSFMTMKLTFTKTFTQLKNLSQHYYQSEVQFTSLHDYGTLKVK